MTRLSIPLYVACLSFIAHSAAIGQLSSTPTPSTPNDLRVTVTNEGNSSFTLTPLWFAFQNGGFDFFDVGSAASSSLEALAEDGDINGLVADFGASGQPDNRQGAVFAPGGFADAPVIEPGETGSAFITPINPANHQYFSFASMVIPSNDTFIGNNDPLAYHVLNAAGGINDPSGVFTISIFGNDLYDSGTEENLGMGAAFSTIMGSPTDTVGGVIGAAGDLMEFLNTGTPAGTTITDFIAADELVATITISSVSEPSSVGVVMIGLGAIWGVSRRRRR